MIISDIIILFLRRFTKMKNASKTMFNIGNIFTIVTLALGALFFIIGIIMAIVGGIGVANGDDSAAAAAAAGGSLIGTGIYLLIASILCLIFVGKAKRELANETTRRPAPFIITIVFGAIASNVFYVLAGIFGLIAEGQQGNN
jgi:hypothetical protein